MALMNRTNTPFSVQLLRADWRAVKADEEMGLTKSETRARIFGL
jgi:hypothetical protein